MELEEAIKVLQAQLDTKTEKGYYKPMAEEETRVVLNHLTKQDKMIELMAEHISFGKDIRKILCSPKVHGKDNCIGITCKRCIKQYFKEKVSEENV